RQVAARFHLARVRPAADELAHGSIRVEPPEQAVEQSGLVLLVADGPVARAPPDLQRDTGERDPPRPVEWAAHGIAVRIGSRGPADLDARQLLQLGTKRQVDERAVAR